MGRNRRAARWRPGSSPCVRSMSAVYRVDNVEATVVEGNFPSTVLLGMTYLRHVKMETGGVSLSRAW